nr:MAG TPA: hypothetical protein [Caudoviricetes sp.]
MHKRPLKRPLAVETMWRSVKRGKDTSFWRS